MNWQDFHFIRPLWLLALLPVVWLLWRSWRSRRRGGDWRQVVDPQLLPHLLDEPSAKQQGGWLWLLLLGWLTAVIALAGPAWQKLPQPLYIKESALVILLDLSRSMDATDITPSRLTQARLRVLDILNERKEGQTGLIAYTDRAFVVSPLTDDTATIANLVPTLSSEIMPSQGSRLQVALERAGQLLSDAGVQQGHILVITDSLSDPIALESARALAAQQRYVSVLGIGTLSGSPIPLPSGGFVKSRDGSIVLAKGDPQALQQLAQAGGGRYQPLRFDGSDLPPLLAFTQSSLGDEIKASERENTQQGWQEEGIWLLLPLTLLAALAFRRGWLMSMALCGVLLQPQPSYALEWQDLWSNKDQQAARAMAQQDYQQAAERFQDPQWRASALYRAGKYAEAAEAFAQFDNADGHYNRGNALAKAGQLGQASEAYQQALEKQPDHEDARTNLALVKKLQQQLQQQSDSPQQGDQAQNEQSQENSSSQGQQGQPDESQPQQTGDQDDQPSEQQAQSGQEPSRQDEQQAQPADTQQAGDEQQAIDQAADPPSPNEGERQDQSPPQPSDQLTQDQAAQQATEQWLRRIPDDPGGLLRRKFQLQYQQQQRNPDESEQPW